VKTDGGPAREMLERMVVTINMALDDRWGMAHGVQRALRELVAMHTKVDDDGELTNILALARDTLAITELEL